ncbi:hypothetical protein EPO15_01540, partial [bacterium]
MSGSTGARRLWLAAGVAALAAAAAGAFTGPTREIRPGTADAGGEHGAASTSYEASPAVGQAAVEAMSGAGFSLRAGHVERAAQPRAVTDLANSAVALSSLTLSWSVPGIDGNRGALLDGSSYYVQSGANAEPAWLYSSAQVKASTSALEPGFRATYRPTGLLANATYYFRVWHRDQDGRLSRLSNETTAHTLALPVSAAAVYRVFATSVTLNWAERPAAPPEDSAEGYRLQASTAPDFTGAVLSSSTAGVVLSTLTVTGLAPDSTYYFRVGTLNHEAAAHYAAAGSTLTRFAQDIPPQNIVVGFVGRSSASLTWGQVNSDGYELQAATASDFTGTLLRTAETGDGRALSLTVTGLDANTTYYLRSGALWGLTTFYAAASTRPTLAVPVTPLAATYLAVFPGSATAAWAALPGSPPAALADAAEGYRLEASTAPDFSGTVSSTATAVPAASTLTVLSPALDPNTTYYFRVGSLNHAAVPNFVSLGSTPTWAGGLDAAVASVFVTSVAASWTPASAQGYALRASTAADFTGTVFVSSTPDGAASGLTVVGLAADTTYYLRAGAYNHAGVVNLSAVFAATSTLAAPATPGFSAVFTSSVTATWTPVTSQGYSVRASTAADFTGTLHSSQTPNGGLGALTVFSPPLDSNTTYYFQVGALNHNGVPNYAVQAATPTAALAPVALGSAVLMVAESSVTLAWAARPASPSSETAEGYRLEAWTAADYTGVSASSSTVALLASTLTVNGTLSANTTYYFRVAALNHAGVPGPYLALGATSTLASVLTASPEPFPGVFPTSVTVSWAALGASRGYLLQASTAANFTGTVVSSQTSVTAASSLSLLSPALDVNATYYFRVGALNHNGVPGPLLALTTATAASPPGPGTPPLTAASSYSVSAQWTVGSPANPAGTVYHLRAAPVADFSSGLVSSVTTGVDATVSGLAADTTYYLQVAALNRFGHPTFTALGSTITQTGPPKTLPVAFLGVFQTSVTAAWAAGGGSGGYRLEASTAANFTGTVVSSETASVLLSTLTASSPALDANTTYYFRVAARNSAGQPGNFTTLGATSTLAAAPSALAAAFLAVQHSSVTAAWAARPASPLSATNEGYRLDASTAPDFSGDLVSSATLAVLVSTLSVESPALTPHTTYYFRVASLNHNGAPGPFLALGSTPTRTALLEDAVLTAVENSSFTAAWSVVTSSGYVLEASSRNYVDGVTVSSLTLNPGLGTLSVLSPALWPNTTYWLRASGRNHAGATNPVVFAATSTLADPATGYLFFAVNRTSVTVNWLPLPTAAAAGSSRTSEGYVLEASTSADFGGDIVSSATPNVLLSTLTVTSLISQTTYFYRVGT